MILAPPPLHTHTQLKGKVKAIAQKVQLLSPSARIPRTRRRSEKCPERKPGHMGSIETFPRDLLAISAAGLAAKDRGANLHISE